MNWSLQVQYRKHSEYVYVENRVFVYREQRIAQDYHKNRCSAHIFINFKDIKFPISVTKAPEYLSTEDK